MSKFTLEIKLGNDTMRTPADVLDVIANSIPTDSFTDWSEPENAGVSETLFDDNGNAVGHWIVQ